MRLVICSIFRDEALYMREWIEFHRLVGVEKFYLYNNRSRDNYAEVLAPYAAAGIVELQDWDYDTPCQLTAYTDCIAKRQGTNERIAFIDLDEFLFSPVYERVSDVLDMLPRDWDAVGVNWVCFGTSGMKEYDDRLVTERFTHRVPEDLNNHIKSVVRMSCQVAIRCCHHAHAFNVNTFKEDGEKIQPGAAGGLRHSSDVIRINHYASKSMQEFRERLAKGDVSRTSGPRQPGRPEGWDDGFAFWDTQFREDKTIWKFLPSLKSALNA